MALLPHVDALVWDHNAYYHRLILGLLPPGSQRVLDAGCGAGGLAERLARRVQLVDAVDRDVRMVDLARRGAPPGVVVRHVDLLADPLPAGVHDAVVSLSVLHHLPLSVALPRLASALRPGGRHGTGEARRRHAGRRARAHDPAGPAGGPSGVAGCAGAPAAVLALSARLGPAERRS